MCYCYGKYALTIHKFNRETEFKLSVSCCVKAHGEWRGSTISGRKYIDEKNEVVDVQTEIDCSHDIFIIGVTLDQLVCFVYDIAAEYDCPQETIYHMC